MKLRQPLPDQFFKSSQGKLVSHHVNIPVVVKFIPYHLTIKCSSWFLCKYSGHLEVSQVCISWWQAKCTFIFTLMSFLRNNSHWKTLSDTGSYKELNSTPAVQIPPPTQAKVKFPNPGMPFVSNSLLQWHDLHLWGVFHKITYTLWCRARIHLECKIHTRWWNTISTQPPAWHCIGKCDVRNIWSNIFPQSLRESYLWVHSSSNSTQMLLFSYKKISRCRVFTR